MATTKLPERKWFSRLLPIRSSNKELTNKQKKSNAERDCHQLLAAQTSKMEIRRFAWVDPTKREKRHRLTVFIGRKQNGTNPPTDPVVKSPVGTKPSM